MARFIRRGPGAEPSCGPQTHPPATGRQSLIPGRFKQELLLAHQVTHKNVIPIYDLGDGWREFITMEFVEGEDLRALILREKSFLGRGQSKYSASPCGDWSLPHAWE